MSGIMKQPCKNCPFRWRVKPYLTPEFATDLAYAAQNPNERFPCHKTTVDSEDGEERVCTEKSLECAGFVTLQINEGMEVPEGFKPAVKEVYGDVWAMIDAYENPQYNR